MMINRFSIRKPLLNNLYLLKNHYFDWRGKATIEGTKRFVQRSNLPLYHVFDKSKLACNPIIHGGLSSWEGNQIDNDYISSLAKQAIEQHRSNAVVVYEHKSSNKEYYISELINLDHNHQVDIKRDEMITIANLGKVLQSNDILTRLERAKELTRLEYIDMVYIEIDDIIAGKYRRRIVDVINQLNEYAKEGRFQSFGVRSSIAPFNQHKPVEQR
jgi:hypothetical protein